MNRLEKLAARRTIPSYMRDFVAEDINEVYRDLQKSDGIKYAIGAMQPISEEYTANTIEQGNRVRNQLCNGGLADHEFKYQGSVTNDTHIKAASDIDLLVITPKFVVLEHPQVPAIPYTGDIREDMRELRGISESSLKTSFPAATVDSNGAKSISIAGGSLSRKVDVVPANWYDSNNYIANGRSSTFRGIQVFDKKSSEFIVNYPFLHNWEIDQKDNQCRGGLRRAIRLMKSLMYDNDLNMSSYDIAGIAYNIPDDQLAFVPPFELRIISSCLDYCRELERDSYLRNSILVPNGTRFVFDANGGATLGGLRELIREVQSLQNDILYENARSFTKLAEARVEHPLNISQF